MTPERRAGRAGSAAFAAMRRALLAEVARIPPGQVVEVGRLAASLTIPARHAAHILSRLAPDEADLVPRHRVIRAQGIFGPPTRWTPRIMQQVARLRAEGHGLSAAGRLEAAPGRTWEPDPGNPTTGTAGRSGPTATRPTEPAMILPPTPGGALWCSVTRSGDGR